MRRRTDRGFGREACWGHRDDRPSARVVWHGGHRRRRRGRVAASGSRDGHGRSGAASGARHRADRVALLLLLLPGARGLVEPEFLSDRIFLVDALHSGKRGGGGLGG